MYWQHTSVTSLFSTSFFSQKFNMSNQQHITSASKGTPKTAAGGFLGKLCRLRDRLHGCLRFAQGSKALPRLAGSQTTKQVNGKYLLFLIKFWWGPCLAAILFLIMGMPWSLNGMDQYGCHGLIRSLHKIHKDSINYQRFFFIQDALLPLTPWLSQHNSVIWDQIDQLLANVVVHISPAEHWSRSPKPMEWMMIPKTSAILAWKIDWKQILLQICPAVWEPTEPPCLGGWRSLWSVRRFVLSISCWYPCGRLVDTCRLPWRQEDAIKTCIYIYSPQKPFPCDNVPKWTAAKIAHHTTRPDTQHHFSHDSYTRTTWEFLIQKKPHPFPDQKLTPFGTQNLSTKTNHRFAMSTGRPQRFSGGFSGSTGPPFSASCALTGLCYPLKTNQFPRNWWLVGICWNMAFSFQHVFFLLGNMLILECGSVLSFQMDSSKKATAPLKSRRKPSLAVPHSWGGCARIISQSKIDMWLCSNTAPKTFCNLKMHE